MAMDSKEKQTWLKVGGIFLLFLAAVIGMPRFGLYFNVMKYQETLLNRKKAETELDSATRQLRELEPLRKRVQESADKIAYYERRLPNSPEAPELLDQLKRIALASGLRFTELQRMPTQTRDSFVEIPMKAAMVVDYHGLQEFIRRVENSDRFAKVDNLNIETNPDDPYRQIVELNLSTFMFRRNADTGNRQSAAARTSGSR